ncbi:hypothetical protein B0H14DRAFT_2725978 [Mycena olivaceomarginata]|nr:hypothetical protein B0H14DRAFT_2725978 [Mycena olivaceomarginata]
MKRGAAPEHDADVAVLDTDAGACRSAPDSRPTQGLSTQSHPRRSWGHATRRVFVRCARCEDGRRAEDPPADRCRGGCAWTGIQQANDMRNENRQEMPSIRRAPSRQTSAEARLRTPHRACFAYNGLCNCRSMAVGRVGAEGPRPSNAVVAARENRRSDHRNRSIGDQKLSLD